MALTTAMMSPRAMPVFKFPPPPVSEPCALRRSNSMSRSLSRVFSNEKHENANPDTPWEAIDMSLMSEEQDISGQDVVYCDDLALSPLPSMETEQSLQRAGVTAQKWALHRSMSTELPGMSPRAMDALGSPFCETGDGFDMAENMHAVPLPPMDAGGRGNNKLSYCIDQMVGCSIQEIDLPDAIFDPPPILCPKAQDPEIKLETLQRMTLSATVGDGDEASYGCGQSDEKAYSTPPNKQQQALIKSAQAAGAIGIWERVVVAAGKVVKPAVGKAAAALSVKRQGESLPGGGKSGGGGGGATGSKRHKKRRVVLKDPNKPKPKPWSEAELEHFRHLLVTEGPNNWQGKASTLGTGRTAKSLHTRWLRDEGRIVDKPRGMAAMRDAAVQELAMRNTQG